MLTCSMCHHTGNDVHMYEYIGSTILTPECDSLEDCFKRHVADWQKQRTVVKTPDCDTARKQPPELCSS